MYLKRINVAQQKISQTLLEILQPKLIHPYQQGGHWGDSGLARVKLAQKSRFVHRFLSECGQVRTQQLAFSRNINKTLGENFVSKPFAVLSCQYCQDKKKNLIVQFLLIISPLSNSPNKTIKSTKYIGPFLGNEGFGYLGSFRGLHWVVLGQDFPLDFLNCYHSWCVRSNTRY